MKFRKKPVVIDATQYFKEGDHPAVILKSDPQRYADEGVPWCPTLEGGHIVTPGDWIITGVKGEHYPCKPDIFALTYELADSPAAPSLTDAEIDAVIDHAFGAVADYDEFRVLCRHVELAVIERMKGGGNE